MKEIKNTILYCVFVRTFLILFYYGSGTVIIYGSDFGFTRPKVTFLRFRFRFHNTDDRQRVKIVFRQSNGEPYRDCTTECKKILSDILCIPQCTQIVTSRITYWKITYLLHNHKHLSWNRQNRKYNGHVFDIKYKHTILFFYMNLRLHRL